MKYCVVHGSPRRGNTYHAAKLMMQELERYGSCEFTEFFLPKDMPYLCLGCFTCFMQSESKCPHSNVVQPIAESIKAADALIFTSPVYVLGESAQMKALLDHLGWLFMVHRPDESMFKKSAMIISTTAGAGTKHPIRTIARSLRWWGLRRIDSCGIKLYSLNWDEIAQKRRSRIEQTIRQKSRRFYQAAKASKRPAGFFARFMFPLMRGMISKYEHDNADYVYWKQNGWLDGEKPY